MQSIINPNFNHDIIQNRVWVTEECTNSDNLLIVVGDSWTWGASIYRAQFQNEHDDYEYRTKQIYGYHLHKKLNYDWVNLAICGVDNITMINHCWNFIKTLKNKYKKIHIVITLTEIGRELTGKNFLKNRIEYQSLQGTGWPEFDELINDSYTKEKLELSKAECFEIGFEIIYALELYLAIKNSKSFNQLLELYENYTFNLISRLLSGPNITCSVARNYTDSYSNNKNIPGINLIDKKWTDIIASNGNLEPYPQNIRFLGQIAINPLLEYVRNTNINDKTEILELLDLSSKGITWLDNSKYNNGAEGYKHPKELAHKWWADYLYETIKW
jgi:hypothetical protein